MYMINSEKDRAGYFQFKAQDEEDELDYRVAEMLKNVKLTVPFRRIPQ